MSVPMSDTKALAAALARAWREGSKLDASSWSLPDEASGQAVHALLAAELGWTPTGRPQHWKCGGSDRQGPFGHAPLAPAGVRESDDLTGLALIGAEAEIALRLKRDVTPAEARALRLGEGEDLIDAMCIAIEGLASRWSQGLAADPLLKNADSQSNGGLALGPWLAWEAGHDWAKQRCELRINDDAPLLGSNDGIGGHGLDDPGWVMVPWLQAATRHGATVKAGSVVTTGSWRVALHCKPGDVAVVRFAGLGEWSAQL